MKESELLAFSKSVLEKSGLVWFRVNNAPGLFTRNGKTCFKPSSMRGFPDLAGYTRSGVGWALELKSKTGRVESHQIEWMEKLDRTNVIVGVARTQEQVLEFVEICGGKVAKVI